MPQTLSIQGFIAELKDKRDSVPFVPDMEIDELRVPEDDILPIPPEVYIYRFELIPPRWMDHSSFAYGEGGNALHFLWQEGADCFALRMTDSETDEFYKLLGRKRFE